MECNYVLNTYIVNWRIEGLSWLKSARTEINTWSVWICILIYHSVLCRLYSWVLSTCSFFFILTMTWQVLLDLWVWIYCWYLPVFVFWHLISEWKRRMCQRDNYPIKERQQPKTTIIFLQMQLSNITPGARGGLYLRLAS